MKQTNIAVSKLRPFENNPYQVRDDAEMNTLIESVQTQGILSPLIVRPIENTDEYEVVSGPPPLTRRTKGRDHRGPCLNLCPRPGMLPPLRW